MLRGAMIVRPWQMGQQPTVEQVAVTIHSRVAATAVILTFSILGIPSPSTAIRLSFVADLSNLSSEASLSKTVLASKVHVSIVYGATT